MLGNAWLTLRQAQEALKKGRLEEADRLLAQPDVKGHKRSWDLLEKLARGYVERGIKHLRHQDLQAAWSDLLRAEQVGKAGSAAEVLRYSLVQRGLADVRSRLAAGEPIQAAEAITLLRQRLARHADLDALEEAAQAWMRARELADRGEFIQAMQTVERVAKLLGEKPSALERFQEQLARRGQTFTETLIQLHEAVDRGRWREVGPLADQILAVAANNAEARKAKARAWKCLEPITVAAAKKKEEPPEVLPAADPAKRMLLWIDGVGGYLICLNHRVTLGQATPDTHVDVPIFADVSRMHASITRDVEGYLIEAVRPIQVNGQATERALLQSGDRVTMADSCQLLFQVPVPLSSSARLDLASGHKLSLSLDGVLPMADTLVIGPGPQAHVIVPDMTQQVVLFRHKDALGIRYPGHFTIDGQRCKDRSALGPTVTIAAEDFSLALEPAGGVLGRK